MLSRGSHSIDSFMIDGGSTCHVLGFEGEAINASLYNKRFVDITIVVGGGTQMRCHQLADLRVRIVSPGAAGPKECVLKDVRLVPGFGANLLSGPRLEDAGYALHQERGVYTAYKDGDLIFRSLKDERGLYFLSVDFLHRNSLDRDVSAMADGQRTLGKPTDVMDHRLSFDGQGCPRRLQGTSVSTKQDAGREDDCNEVSPSTATTVPRLATTPPLVQTPPTADVGFDVPCSFQDEGRTSIEAVFVCAGGGERPFSAVDLVVLTTAGVEESARPSWGITDFSFLSFDMPDRPFTWPPCFATVLLLGEVAGSMTTETLWRLRPRSLPGR